MLYFCLSACQRQQDNLEGWAFKSETNRGWGIIGTDGKILVPCGTYTFQPSSIVNGMFTVPDGTGMSMLYNINSPTKPVCERHFYRIGYFFEKVTIAQDTMNGFFSIIDKKGKTIAVLNFPQFDIVVVHNFHNGRALVISKDGKYGYIDTKGTLIIPPIYDSAYDFREDKALVGINDSNGNTNYQIIKKDGNIAFSLQQNDVTLDHYFSEGVLMYKETETGKCRYMNDKGETCISLPDKVRDCYRFERGRTVYHTNTGAGIIDKRGRIIIPDIYQEMMVSGKDFQCAQKNGKWAVTDRNGKALTPFCYDNISKCHADRAAIAMSKGCYYLLDKRGKQLGKYSYIANDLVAEDGTPEVFVRTSSAVSTTYKEEDIKQPPSTKETAMPQSINNIPLRKIIPPHSVQLASNWRKISRQSPFYNEAAKVLSGKLAETDAKNREMILNYVEHLRSSYTTKDIDFLNQLFSENALIVVGHIIRTSTQKESQYLPASQVVYNVKSKQEYLSKLKLVFKLNKQIQLSFSDFHIMRHPTTPGIYGVSLRQRYTSDRYSDEGYLFLLWDFRNEAEPKIHVRTWQPYNIDEHHTLSNDAVFNIRDFNLQ